MKAIIKLPQITITNAYQISQLLRYTTLIFISVILVKSGFDKVSTGNFEWFLLLGSFFTQAWVSGFSNSSIPFLNKNINLNRTDFFKSLLLLFAKISAILAFAYLIFQFIYTGSFSLFDILFCCFLLFQGSGFVLDIYYIDQNKPKNIIHYAIFSSTLLILLGFFLVFSFLTIEMALLAYVIQSGIRALFAFYYLKPWKKESIIIIKPFLIFALPICISILSGSMDSYADAFFAEYMFGRESLAIYRYGAREFPISLIMANAASAVIAASLLKSTLSDTLQSAKNESLKLIKRILPIVAIIILLSHVIFQLVFSAEYNQSATIFNIYLMLSLSHVLFPQSILQGLGENKLFMKISMYEAILNLILSYSFAHLFGLNGIAIATVISYLGSKFFMMHWLKKYKSIAVSSYLDLKWYGLGVGVLLLCLLISEYIAY